MLEVNPPDDLQNTVSLKYVIKRSVMYDALAFDRLRPHPESLAKHEWQLIGAEELP